VIILIIVLSGGRGALVGTWRFQDGQGTYFFWRSNNVEFLSNGEVYASETGHGSWSVSGNQLTVRSGNSTYIYTYEINGNILSITDSDFDTGRFVRTG
jgi:hypothetical protein